MNTGMNHLVKYLSLSVMALIGFCSCQKPFNVNTGSIKLTIINKVKGSPLVLNTQTYTNPFGETYSVSKFKYYISNVSLSGPGESVIENNSYHLVDEAIPASQVFHFETTPNTFSNLQFVLGVDSARNVSGAQTDALDPLNDMFWTWNSGYVMAKMEGNSPQSNQAGGKIEYHIGGFKGSSSVLKTINLNLPAGKLVNIKAGQVSEITIEADLDSWWRSPNDIKIADLPVCTTPGPLAKNVADNYSKMFTITDVRNNK
ncbi:MAG: MbnP family protein [Ferruginibacter sp.]